MSSWKIRIYVGFSYDSYRLSAVYLATIVFYFCIKVRIFAHRSTRKLVIRRIFANTSIEYNVLISKYQQGRLAFEGRTLVMIVLVPGHCLPFTFYSLFV